ncbi:MAG TPA: hypothetical protein VNZ57_15715 [Longimicrobiales bacterium]|nr:hypothetical protein [Longimicrobiales bacterium]
MRRFAALAAFVSLTAGCSLLSEPEIDTIADMVIASGNEQVAPAGTILTTPFVVKVVNPEGKGLRGVAIGWEVTEGDGVTSHVWTTTDEDGLAMVFFKLGSTPGTNKVTAYFAGVQGVDHTVVFTATGTEP